MAVDEVEGWSEAVEDLVDKGDVDRAIFLLESVVLKLESLTVSSPEPGVQLQLATALSDLADLQSSKDLSIKADKIRSRALLHRVNAHHSEPPRPGDSGSGGESFVRLEDNLNATSSNQHRDDEEGWEAIADRGMSSGEALLFAQNVEGAVSDILRVDEPSASRRRRGRGSFLYRKNELYCDQVDDCPAAGYNFSSEDEDARFSPLEDESRTLRNSKYGTSHVIVLYDFPPTTRTTQLEMLFDKFRERGFVIRWVNDTVALAVFRTPSIANEAQSSIKFPFKVRRLEEEDVILTQISPKDLEPPIVRPKTSARTAQRLIAHAMGIDPSNSAGSDEFRKQEQARRNRIHERQNMKNDAWGSD
ncbi:coiled-coil domain-containing protein R3HCC1L [Phalaenopsis equestris]|uniref:coiled-coil domain-containing protein R3HCC1L n=1 Tax=Phalaenopsis equestris TaxID=78828 RepID=UPI0009E593F1|nr:coiled-coil domain-containing protein R3HCC1L [Phalaenopsis equestris]